MKANRAQVKRALDAPSAAVRFVLLYGPDESQSRDLAARLCRSLGAEAERIDLSGSLLKADPARLADEAASMSLFGGARHVRVEPAGDECFDAVEALLESPSAGNPVVIVSGALRKDSKLLKRALAEPGVLAFASYLPEGGDIARLAMATARDHGLRIDSDLAQRIGAATGGDRALLAREIEKLALYVDAAPDRPMTLEPDAYRALSADSSEGDLSRLVDAVLGGRGDSVSAELRSLAIEGVEGIALIRPILRRLLQLAHLRAEVDRGNSVETVMGGSAGRAIFWKDKAALASQVSRWSSARLATAIERVAQAERDVKSSGSAGPILVTAELLTIARAAARQR